MKKKIFCCLYLYPLFCCCQSESVYISPPVNLTAFAGELCVVDTSSLQVYYAFCASNIHDKETYRDYFCLEFGRKTAKFYSEYMEDADRYARDWLIKHPNSGSTPRTVAKGKYNGWSEYQYSQWYISGVKITEYSCFPKWLTKYNCYHEEIYPDQSWEILPDTLTICGYLCQKANCHFRGRDYVAWFSSKIPLRNGPWKFGGLPGLILKVTDKNKLYSFECVKIEKRKKAMYKYDYRLYKKMDRTNLLKLQRKIHEDIGSLWGDTESRMGKTIHYEPLELK